MDEKARNKLWESYCKSRTPQLREQIIIEYSQLVKLVAGRLSMYLGYNVEYEDLVSYGIFGLIDAIDKFDFDKNVKFETYASLRIRGAILDQIRKMDWIPRSVRQKQKKLEAAYAKYETEKGRAATDEELAEELDLSVEELYNWQGQTKVSNLVSLDEFVEQGSEMRMDTSANMHFEQPETVVEKAELTRMISEALEQLTEKEKQVVLMYYYEDMTLKEISCVLSVSESRVSQLHTKALIKMKNNLGEYMNILTD
ncbi:MAG: FliA/WhiG family RNA polymerase sigma factor [Butyrivibrio sp.]|nr:FliA/WhiG family RNA polymerase sigma factor [Butyrivibrio sp.]